MKLPGGVQLPNDLYQRIEAAQKLDDLLDTLSKSQYWHWIDLRLMNVLIFSSGIRRAKELVDKYKAFTYPKKLSEVLDLSQREKEIKEAYTAKVSSKLEIEPDKITIEDLSKRWVKLETLILAIPFGTSAFESTSPGCLQITWLIPIQYKFHAYKSAMSNRHKFHQIHLQYLQFESYPPIYDPFTIQPDVLSTLLHLPNPVACKLF